MRVRKPGNTGPRYSLSLVVLGGGAIGAELTQVFARFGVEVILIEAADRLLPGVEREAGRPIADVLRRET